MLGHLKLIYIFTVVLSTNYLVNEKLYYAHSKDDALNFKNQSIKPDRHPKDIFD